MSDIKYKNLTGEILNLSPLKERVGRNIHGSDTSEKNNQSNVTFKIKTLSNCANGEE